jgi:hypothetical protein
MTISEAIEVIRGFAENMRCTDLDCNDNCQQCDYPDFITASKMALKSLEAINKIKEQINSNNRGNCDYFIVDNIEEIITGVEE